MYAGYIKNIPFLLFGRKQLRSLLLSFLNYDKDNRILLEDFRDKKAH